MDIFIFADKLEGIEILGMTDEEIINRLTLKVANDVMKIYDGVQTNDKEKSANKKERLLKKIGEFGHFGTSAVQPLDLDQVCQLANFFEFSKKQFGAMNLK